MSRRPEDLPLLLRRLAALLVAIAVLLAVGTAGFVLAEGTTVWGGFVWALDTVSTLGSIVAPTDTGGQIVKVVLIVLGVGTLFYALVTLTEVVVAGDLSGLLRERRERKMTEALADHYVICGFGRVGRQVARDLRAAGARYVVIDHDPANRDRAGGVGVRFIAGEPADDDVLRAAGIERARGIVACVDSDPDNIFITLSARQLRPDILIVARAAQEDAETKLKLAGADRVISPYKASGSEMARLALHPQVFGAVEVAADYRMEEIEVVAGAEGAGRTIEEVRGGAFIVALRRPDGVMVPQPPPDSVLAPGAALVAMGTPQTLARLEALFEPASAPAP